MGGAELLEITKRIFGTSYCLPVCLFLGCVDLRPESAGGDPLLAARSVGRRRREAQVGELQRGAREVLLRAADKAAAPVQGSIPYLPAPSDGGPAQALPPLVGDLLLPGSALQVRLRIGFEPRLPKYQGEEEHLKALEGHGPAACVC